MFQTEFNKTKNLLSFIFSGQVTPEETRRWREKLTEVLRDVQPGFTLMTDLSGLDSMDLGCAPDIESSMEALDEAGISRVVRIIPDPRKDIGLNIMSRFHYDPRVRIVICNTMEEALRALAGEAP